MAAPASVSTVQGCTVLRVLRSARPVEVVAVATRAVQPGRTVALDLHGQAADPAAECALVLAVAHVATDAGAGLVVVTGDPDLRGALRVAGFATVHESLDDALGDLAPVLREEPAEEPSYPAQGDATVVAAEDLVGGATGGWRTAEARR